MLNHIHIEHVRLHQIQSTTVQKENRKQRQKKRTFSNVKRKILINISNP